MGFVNENVGWFTLFFFFSFYYFFFLKQPRSKRSLFILHLWSDKKSIIVIVTKTLWPGCWSQPRSFRASETPVNHSPVGASELTGGKINKMWSKSDPKSICLPMSPWYRCEKCDFSHFLSSQDLPSWKTVFWGRGEPGLWSTTTLHPPLPSILLPGVPLQHDWDGKVAHQTPNPGETLQHEGFPCPNTVSSSITAICHMWAGPVLLLPFGILRDSPPAPHLSYASRADLQHNSPWLEPKSCGFCGKAQLCWASPSWAGQIHQSRLFQH